MELSNKELGQYLKTMREKLGYSIYDVNKLCQISPSYLSLMENGKRRPSAIILKKLAPIYSLDYFDLYVKAGYADLIKEENKSKNIDDILNQIDLTGFNEEEKNLIIKYVEFVKSQRKEQ